MPEMTRLPAWWQDVAAALVVAVVVYIWVPIIVAWLR